ncbi:hypothetical protein HYQ46_007864 [Verticillium longisporum]|nr:hypothetical protein HYQ46_007864 [Verticillium longisporum]
MPTSPHSTPSHSARLTQRNRLRRRRSILSMTSRLVSSASSAAARVIADRSTAMCLRMSSMFACSVGVVSLVKASAACCHSRPAHCIELLRVRAAS